MGITVKPSVTELKMPQKNLITIKSLLVLKINLH